MMTLLKAKAYALASKARSPMPAMTQPTTTSITEQVRVALGQERFQTDCRHHTNQKAWQCHTGAWQVRKVIKYMAHAEGFKARLQVEMGD